MNKKANKPNQAPLNEQLGKLYPDTVNKQMNRNNHSRSTWPMSEPMPPLSPNSVDGVDHINIYPNGLTELGRLLAPDAPTSFRHPVLGPFSCMESMWHYVRLASHDDRLRTMSGVKARNYAKRFGELATIDNFRAIIMSGHWAKIKNNKNISDLMRESTLPFEMYYINTTTDPSDRRLKIELSIRPAFSSWVIMGMEKIRDSIKEDSEPNFDYLMSNINVPMFSSLVNYSVKEKPTHKEKAVKYSADENGEVNGNVSVPTEEVPLDEEIDLDALAVIAGGETSAVSPEEIMEHMSNQPTKLDELMSKVTPENQHPEVDWVATNEMQQNRGNE
jgi:hypothetical protein